MKKLIIPWDLGATKCAMAVVEYDVITGHLDYIKQHTIKLTDCQSLAELIEQFELHLDIKMSDADAICIGAAGIYDGEKLLLESAYPYPMHFAEIAQQFKWKNFAIIHDYAPILCATFTEYINHDENIKYLNQVEINPYGRRVALGIGTGLGVKDGILFPNHDFWLGNNEMGHIGIVLPPLVAPEYLQRHMELMQFLKTNGNLKANEALTFEKILSGQGMVRIHQFVNRQVNITNPEELGLLIRNGNATETLAVFAWYLGLFISTVELTFMPDGGTWITGGVAIKHLEIFDHPELYKGIIASPAYLEKRKTFPLAVMQDNKHAFYGGAYYAVKRLLKSN